MFCCLSSERLYIIPAPTSMEANLIEIKMQGRNIGCPSYSGELDIAELFAAFQVIRQLSPLCFAYRFISDACIYITPHIITFVIVQL